MIKFHIISVFFILILHININLCWAENIKIFYETLDIKQFIIWVNLFFFLFNVLVLFALWRFLFSWLIDMFFFLFTKRIRYLRPRFRLFFGFLVVFFTFDVLVCSLGFFHFSARHFFWLLFLAFQSCFRIFSRFRMIFYFLLNFWDLFVF